MYDKLKKLTKKVWMFILLAFGIVWLLWILYVVFVAIYWKAFGGPPPF